MNKSLLLALLLSVCMANALYAQGDSDSLEAHLLNARGAERLEVLSALTSSYERSNPAKSVAYGREALAMLSNSPDNDRELEVLYLKGRAHLWLSEYDSAMVHAELVEQLARRTNSLSGVGKAANLRGTTLSLQGNFGEALGHFVDALASWEQVGDERGRGNVLSNLGIVHMRLGNYDESLDFYLRALSAWEEIGDQTGIARVLNNTGNLHRDLGNQSEALGFYTRALEIRQVLGDSVGVASLLNNIGIINVDLGNPEAALGFYMRALAIWEEVGDLNNLGRVLLNLSELHTYQDNYEEALRFGERALLLKEQIGDKRGAALVLNTIGMVHRARAENDQALDYLLRSLTLAEQVGEQRLSRDIYGALAGIHEAQGNYEEALVAHRQYKAAHDSLFNAESQSVIAELQTRYQTNEQRQQIEFLQQAQQIQRLWLFGLLGGLMLIAVIAFLIYNRYRLKNRAHTILTNTHEELRNTYNQLKTTQQRLIHAEKMASMGQMTAGIAHEIKNPLNFVTNFSTLNVEMFDDLMPWIEAKGGMEDQDVQELVETMKTNTKRINEHGHQADRIVRLMLEHSRVGLNERRLTEVNALVSDQINWALNSKQMQLPDLEVEIKQNLGADTGEAELVPQEISRVLLNLLGNAFDSVHGKNTLLNGLYTPTITVSTRKAGGHVEIRVSDNGLGIPRENQERIFEPFFTTKPTGSGTGLGLSLSYDIIVKGHGGSLAVESEEGEGATFVIALPIK